MTCWCSAACVMTMQSKQLRKRSRPQISRSIGIDADVVMVPPKSLPFTSSGKLSRAGAKTMFGNGEIAEIAE